MATNPYDTLLDSGSTTPTGARNKYDDLLDAPPAADDSTIRANMLGASKVNPDQYARSMALEKQTGIPAPIVNRNLPQVANQAQFDANAQILKGLHTLPEQMQNPDFANVVHDDVPNAGIMERTLGFLGRSARTIGAAPYDLTKGILGLPEYGYRALSETFDPYLRPNQTLSDLVTGNVPKGPFAKAADFFKSLRQGQQAAGNYVQGDISQAGSIEKDVLGGIRSSAQMLPAIGAAVATDNPELAIGAITAQTGGEAASTALDRGLSTNQAGTYAASQATTAYLFGKLPIHGLIGDIANGSGFLKTLGHNLMTLVPANEGQTLVSNLIDWAQLNPDKSFSEFAAEQPAALGHALVQAGTMSLATVGATHAVSTVSARFAGKSEAANQAVRDAQTLTTLTETAAESKLRARSPDSFQQFVDAAAAKGAVQDVYIDARTLENTLAQSKADTSKLPESIKNQLPEALAIDGDVRIPVGDYAAHVAAEPYAKDLLPHLRTSPEAMSFSEAEAFNQGHAEEFKKQADAIVQDRLADTTHQASAGVVEQNLRDQLAAVNRFTPDVNAAYAKLGANYYSTQAARLGMQPHELFAQHPLNIRAEAMDGEQLGQSDVAQPNRGAYSPDTNTISLLKSADLSTFLHEAGHHFLNVHGEIAAREDAPQGVKDDAQHLMDFFGVKDLKTWRGMSLEEQRLHHEAFAQGFESYLFEGKSPSPEMQPIFSRFRAWLVQVYKSLVNLHVELTPEVRGVMDRMLASDEQIKTTEAMQAYRPLFESADSAGMTPAEFQDYQNTGREATATAQQDLERRSIRDMQWMANAKSKALGKLQREAKAKRDAIETQVSWEVNAEPIYRAREMLKTEGGNRISLERFAEERGITPDNAADMLGFRSSDELNKKLEETPPAKEVIEGKTDQRMLEEHGDLTDAKSVERAAEAAIHNDVRGRFLAREVGALAKHFGMWPALSKAANSYAREAIARKRIRDIRPGIFTVAEARAGRESAEAFKSGDTQTAAQHKRSQLLANRMAKVSGDVLEEVGKKVDYLQKFNTDAVRRSVGAEYSDQIDQLLERFDLRKSLPLSAIDKRKSLLDWVNSQDEIGLTPTIDDSLLDAARKQSFKDMTLEQFRGLVDTVKNIEHLGRLKQRLLTAKDNRDFATAVAEAEASIHANATKTIKEQIETQLPKDKWKNSLTSFLVDHRKVSSLVRQMDGVKDGGTMWERFVRPMNEAGDKEASMREKATMALADIFKPLNAEGGLFKLTYIKEINDSMSKAGRLSIALNWGNEANRQRVLDGNKWSEAQAKAILDTLSKSDWDFVQKVWDHIDSYWPEIKAKEERVSGLAPEKVEASPVVTKHGEYKGGYYPIKYDPKLSSRAEADTSAEAIKQTMQGLYTRATTRRGHTKERVESVERPMRKDLNVVFEHVNQVIHDLSWHEYLIDANRLLRAGSIDSAIREHYGPDVLSTMRAALKDVAQGEIPAQDAFERGLNRLRSGTTIAGLGWNLATALAQPFGLTQSMVRIGPKYIGRGLAKWLGDAAKMENTVKMVNDKSTFMRLRVKTQQREINEVRNQVVADGSTWKNVKNDVRDSFFYLITRGQLIADMPTWLGQYEKSIEAGNDEARAIALADQAVLDAQGGGQIKDLAGIQKGGPMRKLWTSFYSFFNTTYNLTAESVSRTDFKSPASVGRLAVDFLLLYTIPAVLGNAVQSAAKGQDVTEHNFALWLVQQQLSYMASTMVGLREFGAALQGYDNYNGAAGTRFFGEAIKLGNDAVKAVEHGADEHTWKDLNNVAGILFHYPAAQVGRTVAGFDAWRNGEAPPTAILFGPPPKK